VSGSPRAVHLLLAHLQVRSDPYFHVAIGAAVRPLRYEDILIVGTGGTVHNLYRNAWKNIILYRDNFAQTKPPEQWALDFRNETLDAFTKNSVHRRRESRDAMHDTDPSSRIAGTCASSSGDASDAPSPLPRRTRHRRPLRARSLRSRCRRRPGRRGDDEHFAC
jgi:hypothetical protein